MVAGHRFAPISQGEVRRGLLGRLERRGRLRILEVVQQQHAANKIRLSRRRPGIGEVDDAEVLASRRRERHQKDQKCLP